MNVGMELGKDLLVFHVWRLIEVNGADFCLVGRPIRPDVDAMLSGFLQVEEHPTSK